MQFPGFMDDIIFRYVFGSEDSQPVLVPLLNALLERTGHERIVGLSFRNPALELQRYADKAVVLDVVAHDDRRQYNVEVQVSKEAHFKSRSLYYLARLHGTQMLRGEEYDEVSRSIGVCLLGHRLFPRRRDLHSVFRLRERSDGEELNGDLELHFIEIAKFRTQDPRKLGTSAEKWMHMLRFGKQFGDHDLPLELQEEEGVALAVDRAKKAMSDEQVHRLMEERYKGELDQRNRMANATRRAHEAGCVETTRAHIQRMASQGLDAPAIATLLGIALDDVKRVLSPSKRGRISGPKPGGD